MRRGEEEEEVWLWWTFYVSFWRSVVGVARALLQTEQALLGWSAWDGWMDGWDGLGYLEFLVVLLSSL